jgi:hypothetical protein
MTLDEYLEQLSSKVDDQYGRYFRSRFRDSRGTSELGMLASPSGQELEQLRRAVAIMTPAEKAGAAQLGDEQVQRIAADAKVDPGILAIFINGFALKLKMKSEK